MTISVENIAVLAQIYPVAYLVIAFESRSLRYLRYKGSVWLRHTLVVLGGFALAAGIFAEIYMVQAVYNDMDVTEPFAHVVISVAGYALGFVVAALGSLALIANSDPSWKE